MLAIVTVRGYNRDGFMKDIAVFNSDQVSQTCTGNGKIDLNSLPLGNVGISIDPTAFPDIVKFDVVMRIIK